MCNRGQWSLSRTKKGPASRRASWVRSCKWAVSASTEGRSRSPFSRVSVVIWPPLPGGPRDLAGFQSNCVCRTTDGKGRLKWVSPSVRWRSRRLGPLLQGEAAGRLRQRQLSSGWMRNPPAGSASSPGTGGHQRSGSGGLLPPAASTWPGGAARLHPLGTIGDGCSSWC